jgi:adenosylcobinamide-phosphate synthase
MILEYQIALALLLDFIMGDPRWFPHPVRLIGWMIARLENPARRTFSNPAFAGLIIALVVIGITAFSAWALIAAAKQVHPFLGDAVSVFLLYTIFAARDLADHGRFVYEALQNSDIAEARRRVSMLVGRDTQNLTEAGVIRAAVESIAENSVDGVLAPLFFAAIGGPIFAMSYKAASTLDSMIGYRNERYLDFGKTAAKIDDGANWIPARLSAPLIAVAAAFAGLQAKAAWNISRRDGRKHLSPNAGIPEAAFAGALGVKLGGGIERQGKAVPLPEIGEPIVPLSIGHILEANRLMYLTTVLSAIAFLFARSGIAAFADRVSVLLRY